MLLDHYVEERPWGWFKILLESPNYKVKELLIRPGHRVSYQLHHKRAEHWFVVQGQATATVNDRDIMLKTGDAINIPIETKHRMANQGTEDLIFIEVQTGTYFGEDDIVRFADDYKRV